MDSKQINLNPGNIEGATVNHRLVGRLRGKKTVNPSVSQVRYNPLFPGNDTGKCLRGQGDREGVHLTYSLISSIIFPCWLMPSWAQRALNSRRRDSGTLRMIIEPVCPVSSAWIPAAQSWGQGMKEFPTLRAYTPASDCTMFPYVPF